MTAIALWLRGLPAPARGAIVGAACAGVTAAVPGLVVGLFAHTPTAPFDAVELGLPAAILGGVVGLVAGAVVVVARWSLREDR